MIQMRMIQYACIERQVFFPSVFSQGFLLHVSSMIGAACTVYRRSTLLAHCASVLCNIQTVRYTVSIPTGMRSTDFIVDLFVLGARALGAQRRSTVPVSRTHVAVVCVFAFLQTMMNANAATTQGLQFASLRLLSFMQFLQVLPQPPHRLQLMIRVRHCRDKDALEAEQDGAEQKQPSLHGCAILAA